MAKITYTQAELDENFDFFKSIVLKNRTKSLNLDASKEEVFVEFMNRLFANEFKQTDNLHNLMAKTYVQHKPNEIRSFVSLEDLEIKKPIRLVSHFFNSYIKDGDFQFNTIADFNDALAKVYADKMEEVFGDIVFVNYNNVNLKDEFSFKSKFIKYMSEKGYKTFSDDPSFMICENKKHPVEAKEENQKFLLDAYNNVVKIFVSNYANHIKKNEEKFDRFWQTIKLFVDNVELRLTSESKRDPQFIKDKKVVDSYFEVGLHDVKKKNTKFGKHYDKWEEVKKAIKKVSENTALPQDKKTINDFYEFILQIGKALTVVDENNQNYPLNYFVLSEYEPAEFLDMLTYLQKKDALSDKQKDDIAAVKTLVRQNVFTYFSQANIGKSFKVKEFLDMHFKGVIKKNKNFSIDLENEENYSQFVGNVEKVIKQYNLPNTEQCVKLLGNELTNGRKPINLNFAEKEITK